MDLLTMMRVELLRPPSGGGSNCFLSRIGSRHNYIYLYNYMYVCMYQGRFKVGPVRSKVGPVRSFLLLWGARVCVCV